jgi:peptidyl-prolyl cis-trans isomerase C
MRFCFLAAAFAATTLAQFPIASPAAQPTADTVVASVEGKDITLGDIRKMVNSDPRMMQFMQQNPQQTLAQYFMLKYLAAEGESRRLAEQSPLKEQLEAIRDQAVSQAMVNLERDTYPVTSEAIDAYFQANRSKYEQAHIRVIALTFKPQAPGGSSGTNPDAVAEAARRAFEAANAKAGRSEAQAETLAKEIATKLREGADFAKMVEQYSDDPETKASGGDYGLVKPGSAFPEALRKAVLGMNKGEISDPVKVGSAFYIMRLEEKVMPPVAEAREEIVQALRQAHLNEFMTALQNRFKPVVKNADFFARPGAALSAVP